MRKPKPKRVAVPNSAARVVEDPAADVDASQAANLETVGGNLKPSKIPGKR
jgi:hypothetical protein